MGGASKPKTVALAWEWARTMRSRLDARKMRLDAVYPEHLVEVIYDKSIITRETAKRITAVAVHTIRPPLSLTTETYVRQWRELKRSASSLIKTIDSERDVAERIGGGQLALQRSTLTTLCDVADIADALMRTWTPTPNRSPFLIPEEHVLALAGKIEPAPGSRMPTLRDQFLWLTNRAMEADGLVERVAHRVGFVTAVANALGVSKAKPESVEHDLRRLKDGDGHALIEAMVLGTDIEGRPLEGSIVQRLDHWFDLYVEHRARVSLAGLR